MAIPPNEMQDRDEGAVMLAQHLAGQPRAFEQLVDQFGASVYGYLYRAGIPSATVDDLFQETFLRVHAAGHRYNSENPFRAWLLTITNNLIRSHYRKQRVRRVVTGWWRRPAGRDPSGEPVALDPPDQSPGVERLVEARERIRWLEKALDELPDGPRRALMLTQVEGLSQKDAARVLGVPVATVKTWVRRGRLALADALALTEAGGAS